MKIWRSKVMEYNVIPADWTWAINHGLDDKIRAARNRSDSIRDGEGAPYGLLLERYAARHRGGIHLNESVKDINYDFDFLADKNNEAKNEAKAKVRTYHKIGPHWLCSVAESNKTQKTDVYVFGSVYQPEESPIPLKVWICGYMTPEEFKAKAFEGKKGEIDKTSSWKNPFTFKADCLNVPIFALHPMEPNPQNPEATKTIISYSTEIFEEGVAILDKFPVQNGSVYNEE